MNVSFRGWDNCKVAGSIPQPSQDEIKNTLSLWQADLDTAVRYGGELTRAALGAMKIRGDKKYVLVDTKVHMLMPGQCPAIPGWHTDGAPRLLAGSKKVSELLSPPRYSPLGEGPPNLKVQRLWDNAGECPRFHLLVTGTGCLTTFLRKSIHMTLPEEETADLYKIVTEKIKSGLFTWDPYTDDSVKFDCPSCTAFEWGWWHLHTAKIATHREWRFLIRVTESDYHAPQTDLTKIIRTQNTVYSPLDFGW